MEKIKVMRNPYEFIMQPGQGMKGPVIKTFTWLVVCPYCPGDGLTRAVDWESAMNNAWMHARRHAHRMVHPPKLSSVLGDFEDTNLFRG